MRSNTAIRVTAEFADRMVLAMNLVYHKTCGVTGGREKRQYHPVGHPVGAESWPDPCWGALCTFSVSLGPVRLTGF
jgi:hypothetical protein